jgi:hypothetical protein
MLARAAKTQDRAENKCWVDGNKRAVLTLPIEKIESASLRFGFSFEACMLLLI